MSQAVPAPSAILPHRIAALIVVHVFIDVALLTVCVVERDKNSLNEYELYFYVLDAIANAQSCLVVLWALSDEYDRGPRWLIGGAVVACLGLLTGFASYGVSPSGWLITDYVQCSALTHTINWICVFVIAGIVSWTVQLRLLNMSKVDVSANSPNGSSLHISIRQVLVVTTLVAIVLAKPTIDLPGFVPFASHLIFGAICASINIMVSVWAALGDGPIGLRCPIAVIVPAIAVMVFPFLEDESLIEYIRYGWTSVLTGVVLVGSLLVVRACGYRLMKKSIPPIRPATAAS